MKAAVFREVNVPMEIEDIEVSKPGPREVLVRTSAAGICHSDMHFWNGTYPGAVPMVLGHESAGIVEEVGEDVHYVKPGDHVITCLSVFCGHCEDCLTGHLSLCQEPEVNRSKEEEPRWILVDVAFVRKLDRPIPVTELKAHPALVVARA